LLHPAELQFLLRTFDVFGIGTGLDDEAICPTIMPHEAGKAMSALPPEVREEAMALLINTAVVDGKVVPEERSFLEAVARASKTPFEEVEARLAEALLDLEQSEDGDD
ncbi:MAG: hypothetical protein JRI68_06845, partial [Deltaproteobacteria bacterium]|nr:hypothetical protein [Deltaproteobacteria bacterium]